MGDALLFGGSSGGGLRNKPITKSGYESLSEADRNNPYIIWVITNDDGTDFIAEDGTESVLKAIHWDAYCSLDEEDKMDPHTVWIIVDLSEEDYAKLNIDTSGGSRIYTIGGVPSSPERIKGVDYGLDRESYNPLANCVITKEIEDIKRSLGGLSFGVTETGGLRIEYDDGVTSGEE